MALKPFPQRWSLVIYTVFAFISFELIMELFLVIQVFLSYAKCRNNRVCAQFFPLHLSVPETAMGVTLNAQQHSDSEYVQAIRRWEKGVCWGEYCVLLLAILIYWQDMWNPTAAQTADTLWFTSAQRCNQSHSDTSSQIPSNNQFTTHSSTQYCTAVYMFVIKWN
jgi:hypothetical protein